MAASEEQNTPTTPSYILLELGVLEGIFTPIKSSSRVKYTCFDISRRYLVLGSSCGDIFVFLRETLTYLSTVPSKEGSIVQVSIAAEENVLGYASSRGHVLVVEHNAEKSSSQAQRLQLSYEHKGALVTSLQWNSSTTKLFVGDDRGKTTVVNVSTSRTRNLFQMPSTSLMKLDSRIVQLDFAQDHLLVSTLTRCHLCDTIKEQYSQIGKKLRDGDYGACFYPGIRLQDPCTIFSARPGSRFWEVDLKGNVLRTHQFKQALAVPPVKVVSFRKEIDDNSEEIMYNPQTVAFHKLYTIWPSSEAFPFLLTSGHRGLYVFDPKKAKVVLWCNEITGIRNIRSYKNDIYVQYGNGEMAKYSLVTIEKAVCYLYQHGLLVQSAQLILAKLHLLTPSVFQFHMNTALLSDLKQKLLDMGRINLAESLSLALSQLEITADSNSQDSRASSAMSEPMKLESGIYVVSRGRDKESDDDCHCKSSLRSTRWRSSSPMLRQTHGSVVHASPSIKITGRAHSYGKRPQSRSPTPVVLKDKVRSHKSSAKGIKMKNDRPQDDDIETAVSTEPDSPELWNNKEPLHGISLDQRATSSFESPSEDVPNSLPVYTASDVEKSRSCDDCKFTCEPFSDEYASVSHKEQQAFSDMGNETPLSDSFPELDRRSCDSEERNTSRKPSVTLEPQLEFQTESSLVPGSVRKYRPKSIEDLIPYEYRLKSGGTPSTFSSTNSSRESLIFSESQSSGKTTPQTGTPFGRSERNSPMGDIDEILLSSAYKDSVSFDSYFQFAMYGGGMLLPSSMDFSLFAGGDTTDSSIVELSKIKDSISAKLTSTTKGILQNLRNFDLKLKQRGQNSSSELLDVRSKVKMPIEQTDSSTKPLGTRFDDIVKNEAIDSITHYYNAVVNEDFWSFLPVIDISNLLEASRKAKHQLKDPDVIYNKESLHSVLASWLQCLVATQITVLEKLNQNKSSEVKTIVPETADLSLVNISGKDNSDSSFHHDAALEEPSEKFSSSSRFSINQPSQNLKQLPSSLQDFVFIHDQFRLSQSEHHLLSELATLCFQTGTWADLTKLHSFLKKECNIMEDGETKTNIKINDKSYSSISNTKNSFNMYNNYNVNESLEHSIIQQYSVDSSVDSKEISVSSEVLKDSELLLCSIIESHQKESSRLLDINQTLEPTTLSIPKNGDINSIKWTGESVLNGRNKTKLSNSEIIIASLDEKTQEESIGMSSLEETVVAEECLWDQDQFSALFIQNFFHLLDMGRVREIITTENRSMFRTWCSLVKGAVLLSEGDDFNQKVSCGQIGAAIQCLEVNTWTSIILVGHLFQLVREYPAKVVELCIKRSHQVAPRDVLYLGKVSGLHPELFTSYITQFLEPLPVLYHSRLMDRLLQCEEVRWEWIQAVLSQKITMELKCKCGAPRPGSHLWSWKDGNLLLHVLSTVPAYSDKLMQVCCQTGFWLGYLQIIKKFGHEQRHLLTVIQLADIDLISSEHEAGYLPSSIEVWKEVLSLINKQQCQPDVLLCLTCEEKYSHETPYICQSDSENGETWKVTLTWDNIAKKLLECLGPAIALSLLKEFKIPAGSLTPKLYRMCILSQVMDQQQSALSRNMLTYLENYLWSRRPTAVSPEDYQMFLKERQKLQQLGDLVPSSHDSKSVHKQQSRFLEEPEGHWGTQTQLLSFCPLCGVALSSQLPSSTNGITVCSCGHAYHSVCLPEGFCVTCLSKENKEK